MVQNDLRLQLCCSPLSLFSFFAQRAATKPLASTMAPHIDPHNYKFCDATAAWEAAALGVQASRRTGLASGWLLGGVRWPAAPGYSFSWVSATLLRLGRRLPLARHWPCTGRSRVRRGLALAGCRAGCTGLLRLAHSQSRVSVTLLRLVRRLPLARQTLALAGFASDGAGRWLAAGRGALACYA